MTCVTGIKAIPLTIDSRALRVKHVHENRGRGFTHFAFVKGKRNSAWKSVLYCAPGSGVMLWDAVANYFKLPSNCVFIQMHSEGFYGFVLKGGRLVEEWCSSTTLEYQLAQNYLLSQANSAAERYAVVLADFKDPNECDDIAVEFSIPEVVKPRHVTLGNKDLTRYAKIRLQTDTEATKRKQNDIVLAGIIVAILSPVCAAVYTIYGFMHPPVAAKKVEKSQDQYLGLKKTLTTSGINIKARMVQVYFNMKQMEEIKGWKAVSIEIQGTQTVITLERTWGSSASLKETAKGMGYELTMLGGRYQLAQIMPANAVMHEPLLTSTTGTIAYLKDGIAYFWSQKMAAKEDAPITNNAWKQVPVTIQCRNMYAADLDSFGSLMNGWPVTFDRASFTIDDRGRLNGQMTIQVLGGA